MGADINGAYQFNGSVAEVRIWASLLDDETISTYACLVIDMDHPNYIDLASYWKMIDNYDYLQNSSPNNPFLDAVVNSAEWQIPDSTIVYDYSETPRLVDVPYTALIHMCVDIEESWDLDGISWVDPCVNGIEDEVAFNLEIFPNPASNVLTFSSSQIIENLKVYNVLGEIIYNTTPSLTDLSLDVSNWSRGVYLIEAITTEGVDVSRKIVVE